MPYFTFSGGVVTLLDCGSNLPLRVLELPIGIACHGGTPPTHGGSFGTLGIDFCQNWGQFGTIGGISRPILLLAESSLLTIDLVWAAPMPAGHATKVGHILHGKLYNFEGFSNLSLTHMFIC